MEEHAPSVLVVDDNANNRLVVQMAMKSFGWSVQEATGGAEAIEILARTSFDLVLLDLHMPDVDGFMVKEHLNTQDNFTAPVIAVTADNTPASVARCQALGFLGHIVKPVTVRRLADQLTEILGGPISYSPPN